MRKPTKAQRKILEALVNGGRLFSPRWNQHAPWLNDAAGFPRGDVRQVTVEIMMRREWIKREAATYGSSIIRYRLTDAGRSALAAATTTAPAADADAEVKP